ncbi:hypothetical protein ES708_25377 [subsurface metagenome]
MAEEEEKKCYVVVVYCGNCRQLSSFRVPMAVSVGAFLQDRTCVECGCYFSTSGHEVYTGGRV